MVDRENLCDFIKKILVFDPFARYSPKEALQHKFITSAMGNTSQFLSKSAQNQMQPEQRPFQPKASKSTGNLTTAMIYASLAKASNVSAVNTSRTTEDSSEIATPINSQSQQAQKSDITNHLPNVHLSLNSSISPITNKSPGMKPSLSSTVPSPTTKPLKSILKKQPSQNYVNQNTNKSIINNTNNNAKSSVISSNQLQENTLDSQVASLFQPRPASTGLSVGSNQPIYPTTSPTFSSGSVLLENGIRVSLNDLLAAQNYPQQQQYLYNNALSPNYQTFLSPSVSSSSFQSPLAAINTQTATTSSMSYPNNFQQSLYQTTSVPSGIMANSPLIYQQQQPNQARYQTTYQYLQQQPQEPHQQQH